MPGAPMPGGPQAWQPSGQMAGPGGPPPWQPGTPPGYGAPAAPKGGMPGWLKALLIIGVVLAVLGVGVVGCTAFVANRASDSVTSFSNALEKSFGEADPNDYAVDITACVVTENGGGSLAEGTLKNTSGKKQGYLLTVNFLDTRGNIVSTGTDTVSAQAGKTANWTVRPTTLKDIKTCEIDTVNYTPFDS